MCDFRGDPTAIYLIATDTVVPIEEVGKYYPLEESLLDKPAGMYHSYNVTGSGYYYTDGTRQLQAYNGYYPHKGGDYVSVYNGRMDYWGMGSKEDLESPPAFLETWKNRNDH
jgi:hypothetical protein